MQERLEVVMQHEDDLDAQELEKICRLACAEMMQANGGKNVSWCDTSRDVGAVHIDGFARACASVEKFSFDSIVKLYDRDRHKTAFRDMPGHIGNRLLNVVTLPIERFFT